MGNRELVAFLVLRVGFAVCDCGTCIFYLSIFRYVLTPEGDVRRVFRNTNFLSAEGVSRKGGEMSLYSARRSVSIDKR